MDQDERDAIARATAAIGAACELLPPTTDEKVLELLGAAMLTLRAVLDSPTVDTP